MTTQLETFVRKRREDKDMLLISHAVLGFPNWELCTDSVAEMAKVGVDVIELQIPFTDPQADGPYFTRANQEALENQAGGAGAIETCFEFAKTVSDKHKDVAFVFMTYFNVVFQYGVEAFVAKASELGVQGIIIPDLPIEEGVEYFAACKAHDVAPILMFTPTSSDVRMRAVAEHAQGFIYCQARTGVTGKHTKFGADTLDYIKRCNVATNLPVAMGFGIQTHADVDFLRESGGVDIAICCTQAVRVLEADGAQAMGEFLDDLR